ncbi:Sec-independent protein translocase protein TatB [Thalassomonas sp. M1454]|uniref:Sec-independent protein translocase protein TatB n=1 Tax=Thalassomonas sp. M1454 TaxID=2594477 RepID=UPI00117FD33B|nr:Sec-independent protein translocase protein TatB [Thalassomonas sp. M1454]TRX55094.1 Sec-independent protein translocase subunit TatB [Thalassomonas sp. M1454]
MFDIGFWELMVIGVMGLIILGPERLPTAIRTIRAWINNIKQFSTSVQTELKEELRVHELHANLKKAEEQGLKDLSPELEQSVNSLKAAAEEANRPYASNNKTSASDEKNDK